MNNQSIVRKAATALATLLCAHVATADITGNVFQDFNSNGVKDAATTLTNSEAGGGTIGVAVDRDLANVNATATCVTALGADGILGTADDVYMTYAAVQTNASGNYTIDTSSAPPVASAPPKFACRITFDWDAANALVGGAPNPLFGMHPTFQGSGSNTSTQFVADGGSANLGVNYPADFCQNNPQLATTCNTYGAYDIESRSHLYSFPYSAQSTTGGATTAALTSVTTNAAIGSVWGLAYHKPSQKLLAGAYFKRHNGVAPSGLGQIYAITSAGVVANLLNLGATAAGTDPRVGPGYDYDRDSAVIQGGSLQVGKLGIGDVDLSEDGNTLYAIGLASNRLYISTVNAALTIASAPTEVTLPTPAIGTGATDCPAASDVRPFALKSYKGFLYVGMTCTAESTGDSSKLRFYVYRMTPAGGSPVQVASFGPAPSGGPPFVAWNNNEPVPGGCCTENPQPMLTDIEFDGGGNMILGVRDRFGDVTGRGTLPLDTANNQRVDGRANGDTIRACFASGTYSPANCAVSGFSFYNDQPNGTLPSNFSTDPHGSLGGLVQVPGFPDILTTIKDPTRIYSGGIGWMRHADGVYSKGFEVLPPGARVFAGGPFVNGAKAAGMGDMEAACNTAPIQIGNRVWFDANANGVQDPGEPPIANVTVNLYRPGDTAAYATATTDANGNYYFSNRVTDENGTTLVSTASSIFGLTDLTPSTNGFTIRLDNPSNYLAGGALENHKLTIPNAPVAPNPSDTSNSPLTDLGDSDATLATPGNPIGAGNYPTITFNTGAAGDNNFGLDIGLYDLYAIGNRIWFDTNNNGVLNTGEVTAPNVIVELLQGATVVGTTATNASGEYVFDNLPKGSYTVRVAATNWTGITNAQATAAGSPALAGTSPLSGYSNSTLDNAIPAGGAVGAGDGTDKGITNAAPHTNGISSPTITLGPGLQPTGESATTDNDGAATTSAGDASDNMAVDFGFYRLSVGDTLWFDNGAGSNKNNGIKDAAEGALPAGVVVELLKGGVVVASTTTDANGNYVFTAQNNAGTSTGTNGAPLAAGADYTVRVPAGQAPLNGSFSSTNPAAQTPTSPGVGTNDDGDSGTGVANAFATATVTANFTLGVSASGTATPDVNGIYPVAQSGANNGTNHRPNVDLGFTTPFFAIGNRVWYDTNNNGILDAGEQPIAGVKVILLDSSNNPLLGQTLVTDANGYYRFDGLVAGTYTVLVAPDNWTGLSGQALLGTSGGAAVTASGAPLAGYSSSTAVTGVTSGAGSTNNNDKGIDPANVATYTNPAIATGGVRSGSVTVGSTQQPSTDLDNATPFSPTDASTVSIEGNGNDNLAVDFGFFRLSVGNLIWNDGVGSGGTPNDGIRNGTEPGIAGVAVQLVNSGGTVVAQAVTDANGNYSFTQLTSVPGVVGGVGAPGVANGQPILPGNYTVRVPGGQNVLAGATSSADPAGGGQPIGDSRDNGTGTALATGDTNSPAIALTATTASLPAGATQTNATGVTVQPRMDFAFVVPIYAIGNRIWFDTNNNGVKDAGEAATPGVLVELVNSANAVVATTATNAAGEYIFDNLPAGTYTVRVASTNWAVGGITSAQATAAGNAALAGTRPLQGYANSTAANPIPGTGAIGTADGTDKGINSTTPATSGISSPPVTVGPGPSPTPQLPTGESAAGDNDAATTTAAGDANDNMAVDFGFYRLTAGNQIWLETNGNSTYTSGTDATPPSVQGITVELRDASTNAVIATTTTDASGNYQFVSLSNGNPIPAGAYYVSLPTLPAGTQPIPVGTALTDNNNQGATPVAPIAGVAVRTGTFNLAPGVTTENQTVTSATGTTAQPTLDIGFQSVYSLGNRVWVDANNNGTVDPSESGLDGVTVNLRDGAGAQLYRTPTGAITTVAAGNTLITTTTSNGGHYLFTNLPAGSYTVEIVTPTVGGTSYVSSTGVNGALTGPYEPTGTGTFANTATNFDHGVQFAPNTIRSSPITLGPGQPTGEDGNTTPGQTDTTPDNQSNLTVDFGVFLPATVGTVVWIDNGTGGSVPGDGVKQASEPGIPGVIVRLLDGTGNPVDGDPVTPGVQPITTVTGPNGEYSITNLVPGTYQVEFVFPPGARIINTVNPPGSGSPVVGPDSERNEMSPSTQRTPSVTLAPGDNNPNLDSGVLVYDTTPLIVPTLGEWARLLLAMLLLGVALIGIRRHPAYARR
jgi:SdrD B-like domain